MLKYKIPQIVTLIPSFPKTLFVGYSQVKNKELSVSLTP